jgi:hypothetical protein
VNQRWPNRIGSAFPSSSGGRYDLTNIGGNEISRPRAMPRLSVDTHEIRSRFAAAWRAHHEEEEGQGAASPDWQDAIPVIPALCAEVHFLYRLLADERRRYADLLAAVRAALGAAREGEADPLSYLRDELPEIRERRR